MQTLFIDKPTYKSYTSDNYNYFFRKSDGIYLEWGATKDDDPKSAPFPNIADIEVSSAIDEKTVQKYKNNPNYIITNGGCTGIGCSWCYKQNGLYNNTIHMSLTGFKKLADKLPEGLCQIAFGITTIDHHSEIWQIFQECKKRGWAANVTVNGGNVDDNTITKLSKHCNAIAVSVNKTNKQKAYGVIQKLTQQPEQRQINIHSVLSVETFNDCMSVIEDCRNDIRLEYIGAAVMLMFKSKSSNQLTTITDPVVFGKLVARSEALEVPLGFDSCSAYNYMALLQNEPDAAERARKAQYVTPCCAGRFSMYVDVFGYYHACSFLEGRDEWGTGLNVLKADNFIKDIWNHPQTKKFRQKNIECSEKMCNPCNYFNKK